MTRMTSIVRASALASLLSSMLMASGCSSSSPEPALPAAPSSEAVFDEVARSYLEDMYKRSSDLGDRISAFTSTTIGSRTTRARR